MPRPGETASAGHTVIDRKTAISAEERMQTFHARLKERGLKGLRQSLRGKPIAGNRLHQRDRSPRKRGCLPTTHC